MLLSIIIPVYNVENFVEKCIRSCLRQDISHEDYEIICINDGSYDNSLNIINKLSIEFPNIKVVSQPNEGLSSARNTGIKIASGEYLMFVDSDDWITDNCLKLITDKLHSERPDALAICASNNDGNNDVRRWKFDSESALTGREYLLNYVPDGAPFAIWKSDLFHSHNFHFKKGIFHEDSELTPRMYYSCKKVSRLNDIIYHVYQNPNSITRSVNYKRAFDYITEVCVSLDLFAKEIPLEDRLIFHNRISIYINNALRIVSTSSSQTYDDFNKCLYKHRYLFKNLLLSNKLKYKLQYIIFSYLIRDYINAYNMMNRICKPFV